MTDNKIALDKENIIQEQFDYDFSVNNNVTPFNITFGIDKNFLFGCGIAIASILLNNSSGNIHFHVFTDTFDEQNASKFSELAESYNTKISIYIINCEQLKSLPNSKNWTYATYFRFVIADYFVGKIDKILYLDADIACKGSISELINTNFSKEEIVGAIEENGQEWWNNRSERLGVPELAQRYFNAGVLLININEWDRNNVSQKAIEMLSDPEMVKKITHLDQDVLNILLVDKVKYIDGKFNTRFSLNYMLKKSPKIPINDETVIIHYIGPTKPWHQWANYECCKAFLKAKEFSPWRLSALQKPSNVSQWRYAAKHYYKQKKYTDFLLCYSKYFLNKLFGV